MSDQCVSSSHHSSWTSVIISTIFGTVFVIGALALAAFYFWQKWKLQKGKNLILETDLEKGKDQFAFDNPCFKDAFTASTPDANRNGIPNRGHQEAKSMCKWSQWSPFNFNAESDKRRAFDDSCVNERTTQIVSLRSHDFTGLGFNICGNMRDGIFIKDLLQHGPASKSGKLKIGDRVKTVSISFENMVYEDALTILSYASPYAVEIEVQSCHNQHSLDKDRGMGKAEEPAHPRFKSASISDLSKIKPTTTQPLQIQHKSLTLKPSTDTVDKAGVLPKAEQKLKKIGAVLVFPNVKEHLSPGGEAVEQNDNNQNREKEQSRSQSQSQSGYRQIRPVKRTKSRAPQPPPDKQNKCRRTASTGDIAKIEMSLIGLEKSKSSNDLKTVSGPLNKSPKTSNSDNGIGDDVTTTYTILKKATIWGNLEDAIMAGDSSNHGECEADNDDGQQSFSLCAKFDQNISKSPILQKHPSVLEHVSLTNSENDDYSLTLDDDDYKSLGNLGNPKSNVLKNVIKIKKLISSNNLGNEQNNIVVTNGANHNQNGSAIS